MTTDHCVFGPPPHQPCPRCSSDPLARSHHPLPVSVPSCRHNPPFPWWHLAVCPTGSSVPPMSSSQPLSKVTSHSCQRRSKETSHAFSSRWVGLGGSSRWRYEMLLFDFHHQLAVQPPVHALMQGCLGFGLFLWGLWASGDDAGTVMVTSMVLSSSICCPYCSCAVGHHVQVWLGQSHKAQPALAIGEESVFRVSLAGGKLRNYSVCWECLRWENRLVMGWGVWKPRSVGMMEHLSAPVPFLLHWPKPFLDEGYTSIPEIKKCKNER